MKTQAKGILCAFLVVSGPLLLSEAGETYDLYVIGTQESGGTIRRGCVREPKNERKKRQPFFFLLFVLGNVGLKPVLASHVVSLIKGIVWNCKRGVVCCWAGCCLGAGRSVRGSRF